MGPLLHYTDEHFESQNQPRNGVLPQVRVCPSAHFQPAVHPACPLLSPSISSDHSVRLPFPVSHVCTCIQASFIQSLKRSIWLVTSETGTGRDGKSFSSSLPPTKSVLCRACLNGLATLRPKDNNRGKGFSVMCQLAKPSLISYLFGAEGSASKIHLSSCLPNLICKSWLEEEQVGQ